MTRWTLLDIAQVHENGKELRLYKRGAEFSIRVGNSELMNSRVHGSEDVLAELVCGRIADLPRPWVLIGGLGMGYTLTAALRGLGVEGWVVVAEHRCRRWWRGTVVPPHLAGYPLYDKRVTVCEVNVARIIRTEQCAYDAILLDVDNGPERLTRTGNDWLYSMHGLAVAVAALRPRGILALWSAAPDKAFTRRLHKVGFKVDQVCVRARGAGGGARHTIWIAGRAD